MQCTYWHTEAIYGAGIYCLVQALLNGTSIVPRLLVTSLETIRIIVVPAKGSIGLCHLE